MTTDSLGYILAFLLGAIAMGLGILFYTRHQVKTLARDMKLQLMADGEDPALVDKWLSEDSPFGRKPKRGRNN